MDSTEGIDSSLEQFFDEKSWKTMSDYEKCCLSNKKKGYEFLLKIGLKPCKPEFMMTVKNSKYDSDFQTPKNFKRIKKNSKQLKEEKLNKEVPLKKKTTKPLISQLSSCSSSQPDRVFLSNLMSRTKTHIENLEKWQGLLEMYLEKIEENDKKHS
ncbi:hypothetical protein CDAR_255241 [Caerostris darwini]|uniref:KRAB-related domain-containing protein n=1 Tax=Caerostris darwini TaxID=1538125 RepID=A0AAV4V1P9_9ARAC|nr:hypothetical protein CDAR_255241 [Caerostris darwini]